MRGQLTTVELASRPRYLQVATAIDAVPSLRILGDWANWVALTSTQKTNTPKMTYVVKILEL